MPWSSPEKHRAYQHKYNSSPDQIRKRAMRNKARAMAEKKYGKAAIAGKDIDHKRSLDRGGSDAPSNLRVLSIKANRGFSRDSRNNPTR